MEIKLVAADRSLVRQVLRPIVSLERWWMTYRLPFQKYVRITYPPRIPYVRAKHSATVDHETVHAEWFATWWGPWLIPLMMVFPLPFLFTGRWFVERPAYLLDIKTGRCSVENAVNALWTGYAFPWPKPLMHRWFNKQLGK